MLGFIEGIHTMATSEAALSRNSGLDSQEVCWSTQNGSAALHSAETVYATARSSGARKTYEHGRDETYGEPGSEVQEKTQPTGLPKRRWRPWA